MAGTKKHNEYERLLGDTLYTKMPKAVLAAVAVSLAAQLSGAAEDFLEAPDAVRAAIREEWDALYFANVVPQAPPKEF